MCAPIFASLDETAIAAELAGDARHFAVEVIDECTSTNTELLFRAKHGAPSGTVLVATRQTGGRGRRGRTWHAEPNASLTFSLLWRFPPARSLSALPLAVGLALGKALGSAVQLKWPNDLLCEGRKLGGILVEVAAPQLAVIGIGINLSQPASLPQEIADNTAFLADKAFDTHGQTAVLVSILRALLPMLDLYADSGFVSMRETWLERHAFQDKPVRLIQANGSERIGICRGVDVEGALLFETAAGLERLLSGDLSLRLI